MRTVYERIPFSVECGSLVVELTRHSRESDPLWVEPKTLKREPKPHTHKPKPLTFEPNRLTHEPQHLTAQQKSLTDESLRLIHQAPWLYAARIQRHQSLTHALHGRNRLRPTRALGKPRRQGLAGALQRLVLP